MSETYTPTDTGTVNAGYTMAEDGDTRDVASVRVTLEALADDVGRIARGDVTLDGVKTFPDGIATTNPPGGYTRTVGSFPVQNTTGTSPYPASNTLAFGVEWYYPLVELPDGATITAIGVTINPANDALPTTKVQIKLTKIEIVTGTSTVVESGEDPYTLVTSPNYQDAHIFQLTVSPSEVIDLSSYSYFLTLVGESGGDEDNVSVLGAPYVVYTLTTADLGH